jgi:hypothetical protein
MSSEDDLERLLRDARETLPEPDAASSRRARERALAAIRRRRPRRVRAAVLIAAVLVVAVGLGVGIGALVTPPGEAAKGPVGLGFVPEPGWFAVQSPSPVTSDQVAVAMAANAPFARDDALLGLAESSALPYSTLLGLKPQGIVIVGVFTIRADNPWDDVRYPEHGLPLQLRGAATRLQYGTQVRPEQPLGQFQLQASVEGMNIDVYVYFGTPDPSPALLAEAQRQLDRLIVRRAAVSGGGPTRKPSSPSTVSTPAAPGVIDRTVTCVPVRIGGVRQIDTLARGGSGRQGSSWNSPAFAAIRTTISASAATAVDDNLVWVTAGAPSATATVVSTLVGITFPMRSWGTLAVSRTHCRTSTKRIPLTKKGLSGGAAGPFEDRWDCATGQRVLVRVRAVVQSKSELKSYRGFLRTTVPVKSASLVVATEAGKTLSYAEVLESGKSRLFVAPTCFPD